MEHFTPRMEAAKTLLNVEEPSISISESGDLEEGHVKSPSSKHAQPDKEVSNLLSSDDEPQPRKVNPKLSVQKQKTLQLLEDLVKTRPDQGLGIPRIEAPELKHQFDQSDSENEDIKKEQIQYKFVGVEHTD